MDGQRQMRDKTGFANMSAVYIAIGVLIVVAVLGYVFYGNVDKPTTQTPLQVSGVKSVNEIREIASAGLGSDVGIVSIELEEEDAGLIYKVKLSDGRILFFNAESGAVVIDPSDDGDDVSGEETDDIPDNFVATVTLAQARSIAEARRPGETVKKIEMEMEEGVGVYSVRFTDSGRVDVNALTGEIMRVEAGDNDNDDDSN